jgi:uncharacterized protein YgiM (DUF1202 family)
MRMELLTDYINHMEGKLKRVILLTESIIDIENKYVSASHQNTHEFTDSESEVETLQYTDTRLISTPPHIDEMFTPTHTVNARLHLRRSASSESTALAVIEVGSRVEYIRQDGDWYYVNAPSYGEGWCSSDYLSPLPQNQQRTTSLGVITAASKMDKKFTPTHTVKARLNLRRSASSESTAIAVMEAGSRVEYIRKSNGWYYVKTASYGEGWCSSEYLSTSLENQQYASVI